MFVVGVFLRKTFLSNIFPKGKFNFRSQLRHFLPDLENVALLFEKLFLSHFTQGGILVISSFLPQNVTTLSTSIYLQCRVRTDPPIGPLCIV